MKFYSLTLAIAAMTLAVSAQAAVTVIGSQAALNTAGTVVQNTNFDTNGAAFFNPGSPYTIGALTFVAGSLNLIGGMSAYGMSRSVFTDNAVKGTTVQISGTNDLFAFNAGNFFNDGVTNIDIVTNLGSYHFTPTTTRYADGGTLTFLGYQSGPAEHFTSVTFSGSQATGGTDFQIGMSGAVPEPASWALFVVGFGLVGAAARRRTAVVAA